MSIQISHCDLAVWLSHRNAVTPETTNKEIVKREINTMLKKAIVNIYKKNGYGISHLAAPILDTFENPMGKIDGIIKVGGEYQLLMILPMSGSYYKATMKSGLPEHHYAKAQVLMSQSDKLSTKNNSLKKCLVIMLNRDNLSIEETTVEYNDQFAMDQTDRIDSIITSDEMPPKDVSWKCKMCPYSGFCDSGLLPNLSCSTCANASARSGSFDCAFGNEACSNHLIHPQIMASIGYPILSVNAENRTCDYGEFVMAPEGFKDKEKKTVTSQEFIDLFEAKEFKG